MTSVNRWRSSATAPPRAMSDCVTPLSARMAAVVCTATAIV
jgi:hypothetical protein